MDNVANNNELRNLLSKGQELITGKLPEISAILSIDSSRLVNEPVYETNAPQQSSPATATATPEAPLIGVCGDVADKSPIQEGSNKYGKNESAITNLAKKDLISYDHIRKDSAKSLKIRPEILDELVKAKRKELKAVDTNITFENVISWAEVVDPAELLDEIATTVRRYIVCSKENSIAVALWVTMTWFIDVIKVAPLAVITAPEKRCGKSQLLTLIGYLSRRPLTASNISPAALFRSIEMFKPTILIDEADTFLKGNEDFRGFLNCGHTRESAFIIRVSGEDFIPTRFNVWGAKAISGIGKLSDTLMDRSIILTLRRKLPDERVERLRNADRDFFKMITSRLSRFSADCSENISLAKPYLPETLNDRAQDNWEPLFAIADIAGGEWPEMARKVALKMSGSEIPKESVGTELLRDIKLIFETRKVDRIGSGDLIEALCTECNGQWGDYKDNKEISAYHLSKLLGEYDIQTKSIRIGNSTPKGFFKNQFEEAFERYLPDSPENNATTPQCSINAGSSVAEFNLLLQSGKPAATE